MGVNNVGDYEPKWVINKKIIEKTKVCTYNDTLDGKLIYIY